MLFGMYGWWGGSGFQEGNVGGTRRGAGLHTFETMKRTTRDLNIPVRGIAPVVNPGRSSFSQRCHII